MKVQLSIAAAIELISNVDNLKSYSSKKGHFPCLYIKMKKWPNSKSTKATL
ncbi:hypothetical protein VCRA2121O337_300004 [Vibrio crassostreae]|nr:hypothetical protein VCRA2120E331_290004 [Vibrio crassostreae]CAK3394520.1 hypothetical protein VCRA2127O345_290004 [Vibrio crassostreae]CAK3406532.1 hypothetical protein VCRA2120E330_290004 [Vibrio crassostreae]CAK3496208.1 hypothetical protein VCRA2122O340_290004 [Vibrio crassostreae]CAK3850221.1 hypothetical protein VCRA2121O337_300004 [Vibrio crassostreae]